MGDWINALQFVLFVAKLGFAVAILLTFIQIYFLIHDNLVAAGSAFVLFFSLAVAFELRARKMFTRKPKEYIGRHCPENIKVIHDKWLAKIQEDRDMLFTMWLEEKHSTPAPLF